MKKASIILMIVFWGFSCSEPPKKSITKDKPKEVVQGESKLEQFTTQDANRYCNCLDGYTRFMQEHFWYQQKYDIDSDLNTQAVENSMIVLRSCVDCIVETSGKDVESERWNYIDNLSEREISSYNQLFDRKFRNKCGQSAEMFVSIFNNLAPTDRYKFVEDNEKK